MNQLGELLRELRKKRGLSQEHLAALAKVTPRAVRYWEASQQQPRELELECLLKAMAASPSERAQVCALLTAPRSVRLAAGEMVKHAPAVLLGPLPGIGDLLRAMRLRRRWTQDRLAEVMRVNRATVIRWEATRSLPSDEDMDRLCIVLRALPEEQAVLGARRLTLSEWQGQLSLEECLQQYETLMQVRGKTLKAHPLVDLQILALKRQIRLLLSKSPEALRLLANLEIHHGWWLFMQGRTAEACAGNWRALNLVRGQMVPEEFWARPLNILSAHAASGAQGPENGVKLLYPWLRLLPESLHSWLLCDMAFYASQAQRQDEADHFLKLAQRAFLCRGKATATEDRYFRLTKARVLLNGGKAVEAMEWLPAVSLGGDGRIHELLIWAETYVAAGEKNAAAQCVSDAQALLTQIPLPKRQDKLERLARLL